MDENKIFGLNNSIPTPPVVDEDKEKELKRKRELGCRYNDFCEGFGNRMFTGESYFINKKGKTLKNIFIEDGVKSIEQETDEDYRKRIEEETERYGKPIRSGKRTWTSLPKLIPGNINDYIKKYGDGVTEVYSDDILFNQMIKHPAFKQKINGSQEIVDVGNGGNDALRVDASFLQRNGFVGKVIGVDPFRNIDEINTDNDLSTIAIKQDGLSYLLERSGNSSNVMCSNLDDEIIKDGKYASALVEEIFKVVPSGGLFISIQSQALDHIAKRVFPYCYEVGENTYIFSKTPIFEENK